MTPRWREIRACVRVGHRDLARRPAGLPDDRLAPLDLHHQATRDQRPTSLAEAVLLVGAAIHRRGRPRGRPIGMQLVCALVGSVQLFARDR